MDRTTFLDGTEQMLELLAANLVPELHASSSSMSEYYQVKLDGAVMAIQNTGGNAAFRQGRNGASLLCSHAFLLQSHLWYFIRCVRV